MDGNDRQLRVAIVGGGPSGIYAADKLLRSGASVDLFEKLPTPLGLLRYGVAPDHFKMKRLQGVLQRTLENPGLRFFGNVELGRDFAVRDLVSDYHAVLYAVGLWVGRRLEIPGSQDARVLTAREVVGWYNGYPLDSTNLCLSSIKSIAVIGAGNVALDVARMLTSDADALAATDVPDKVLRILRHSRVREVHIIGRSPASHARFTMPEISELESLPLNIVVHEPLADLLVESPIASRLRAMSARVPTPGWRELHFHFGTTPLSLDQGQDGFQLNLLFGTQLQSMQVELVVAAIGFRGSVLQDLPVVDESGVISSIDNRVLRAGGEECEFTCGWSSRGPLGTIGINKADAVAAAEQILNDSSRLLNRDVSPGVVEGALNDESHRIVRKEGWLAIRQYEEKLGARRAASAVKVDNVAGLLDLGCVSP